MRAMDVMTTNVITVSPDTSVQEVAKILSERSISGVPVVDAQNRLVGIVSEGDLLHRVEMGTDRRPDRRTGRRRSWWLDTVGSDEELARAYVKSHGRTARDVMTSEVTSVSETTELADIANLLETKRIKRVPVVRDGKLVGIVSRANLVRALAAAGSRLSADTATDDRTIRQKLLAELQGQEWVHAWAADIIVRDGVVHIWVSDDRPEEEQRALRVAAENVPGVRGVEEHIVPAPMIPPGILAAARNPGLTAAPNGKRRGIKNKAAALASISAMVARRAYARQPFNVDMPSLAPAYARLPVTQRSPRQRRCRFPRRQFHPRPGCDGMCFASLRRRRQWGFANDLVADRRPGWSDILFAGTRPTLGPYRKGETQVRSQRIRSWGGGIRPGRLEDVCCGKNCSASPAHFS